MARRRNSNNETTMKEKQEEKQQEKKEKGLVLSDPGQMTVVDERPDFPRVVNLTPDGRIKRIDY